MNERLTEFYAGVAQEAAYLSRARRLQVGCVIVKDDRIISFAWNGTPSGWDNNCEDVELMSSDAGAYLAPEEIEQEWPHQGQFWVDGELRDCRYSLITKPEVIHAEMNAMCKVARSTESCLGAAMFLTHAPCVECAKAIYQSGITTVYYANQYRSELGIDLLKQCGVRVVHRPASLAPQSPESTSALPSS
jgi:dCMP deaminase